MTATLAPIIDAAWDNRAELSTSTQGEVRDAVSQTLGLLDAGKARVAEPDGQGGWLVNQWLKKAVLLSFRLNENTLMEGGPGARGTIAQSFPPARKARCATRFPKRLACSMRARRGWPSRTGRAAG